MLDLVQPRTATITVAATHLPSRLVLTSAHDAAAPVVTQIADRLGELSNVAGLVVTHVTELDQLIPALGATDVEVVYDPDLTGRRYRIAPALTGGYTVALGPNALKPSATIEVGSQLATAFTDKFEHGLAEGTIPQHPPLIELPDMKGIVARLHSGPNFGQIVHAGYAAALPGDWALSFGRVSPAPFTVGLETTEALQALAGTAFSEFEEACNDLVDLAEIREIIASGVHAPSDRMLEAYLSDQGPLAVRRLDMVVGPMTVTENDEMPGGLPDAYHQDWAYGINRPAWMTTFEALFQHGPVVFLVSTEWSKVYIKETEWFAGHLRELGYQAYFLTTDDAKRLKISSDGVTLDGESVGTIWRQFPIFEAEGHVAELVLASQRGLVKMAPQYTHLGNKAWFGVFWSHQEHFKARLTPESFALLRAHIPYTQVVVHPQKQFSFKLEVNNNGQQVVIQADSIEELKELAPRLRKHLVIKVGGANRDSARMYGVLLGDGISTKDWRSRIDNIVATGAPIIVQLFHEPEEFELEVLNVLHGKYAPEIARVRALARPWVFGDVLVAMMVLALPNTKRLHGTSDSCQLPVRFTRRA